MKTGNTTIKIRMSSPKIRIMRIWASKCIKNDDSRDFLTEHSELSPSTVRQRVNNVEATKMGIQQI